MNTLLDELPLDPRVSIQWQDDTTKNGNGFVLEWHAHASTPPEQAKILPAKIPIAKSSMQMGEEMLGNNFLGLKVAILIHIVECTVKRALQEGGTNRGIKPLRQWSESGEKNPVQRLQKAATAWENCNIPPQKWRFRYVFIDDDENPVVWLFFFMEPV